MVIYPFGPKMSYVMNHGTLTFHRMAGLSSVFAQSVPQQRNEFEAKNSTAIAVTVRFRIPPNIGRLGSL